MPWRSLRSPHHRDCVGHQEQHQNGRDLHEACSDYFGVFFSIHSIREPFGATGFALAGKHHDCGAGLRGGYFSTHINHHINFIGNGHFGHFSSLLLAAPQMAAAVRVCTTWASSCALPGTAGCRAHLSLPSLYPETSQN